MNHQPAHHPPSLNFISPVPLPSKPSNASDDDDDDVAFLCSVPKVPHTPEEYDPKCKCSTCQLATKIMAECTCVECRGKQQANQVNQAEGQVEQSSKNGKIPKEEPAPNAQTSKLSIQNNCAAPTNERMNGNDQNDGRESRSATPDNVAQLFDDDDESSSSSSDSSSEDSEDDDSVDVEVDDKELSQESESDDNSNEYAFSSNSLKKSSAKGHLGKHTKTIEIKTSHKCPSFNERFSTIRKLKRHYREQHQQLKRKESVKTSGTDCSNCGRNIHKQLNRHLLSHKNPGFRCVWPNCGFFYAQLPDAKKHVSVDHLQVEQATSQQTNQHLVKVNPSTGKTGKVNHYKSSTAFNSNCPKCGRNFRNGGLFKRHLGSHTKSGFRCTWRECGFFFYSLSSAKQHILIEHFKGKMINSKQINEHVVKVEPKKKHRDQERKAN